MTLALLRHHRHHNHVHRAPHVLRSHASAKDPTHTTAVRIAFEQEVNKRFADFRKLVRTAVVGRDVFGLAKRATSNALPGQAAYDFPKSADQVSAFMKWVDQQSSLGILGVEYGTPVRSASQSAWANVYLQTSYQKGLAQAANELRSAGVQVSPQWVGSAFYRPINAEAVGQIYTRSYEELQNVTEVMADQMRDVLATGLADGIGANELADLLSGRVDSIGRTRARTIARTEVISAHATATLSAYKEAGIEGVGVRAEWGTAGDDSVCPECEDMEGQTFTMEEAEGMIPLHPNCRCAWLPVVSNPQDLSLDDSSGDAEEDDQGDTGD